MQNAINWLPLFTIPLVAFLLGYQFYQLKKTVIIFPEVPFASIHFDERAASGCSYKTRFTRLGGASRCLHVTVTDTEVWIRPVFPVNVLAKHSDLQHRIPRASITSAQLRQSAFFRSILLEYRDLHGQLHRLSLVLKKPDDFLRALGLDARIASS